MSRISARDESWIAWMIDDANSAARAFRFVRSEFGMGLRA